MSLHHKASPVAKRKFAIKAAVRKWLEQQELQHREPSELNCFEMTHSNEVWRITIKKEKANAP